MNVDATALGADYLHAPTGDELEWQAQGLCRMPGQNPLWWFPENPEKQFKSQRAKNTCLVCPVIEQCRAWALERHEVHGVWGGMTEKERTRYWKAMEGKKYRHRIGAA